MAINEEIFLGSGATLSFVPEVDFYIKKTTATGNVTQIIFHSDQTHFRLIKDLYVGCTIDRYDASNVLQSTHTITGNSGNSTAAATIDFTPQAESTAADDYFVIRGYAAPCPAPAQDTSIATLNADNSLGLVESATFPNIEVEMRQLNLALGGTRNFTHQFKGIETASGGNINLISNQGHWLYYALGKCSTTTVPAGIRSAATSGGFSAPFDVASADQATFLHEDTAHIEDGPIFYRTIGTEIVPPLMPTDTTVGQLISLSALSVSNFESNFITYIINEQDTAKLPSFALEQSISKLESTNTYKTDIDSAATESHTFVRVARGNRINTLTLTANENEEVKMTMDLNTSAVTELDIDEEMYARRNQEVENFSNRKGAQSGHLEPFFFTDGTITIYNQQLLKITNLTLTINNNIQDKRFVGMQDRGIKQGIPAQRTYELSFTALVTDDKLFREFIRSDEETTYDITLQFDKSNGEQIKLEFENYFTNAANWTIPEDKGPVTVEATVMPRGLKTNGCTIITHAALMG
jgi:hypothetical protein